MNSILSFMKKFFYKVLTMSNNKKDKYLNSNELSEHLKKDLGINE